ncbi:PD-(D/E)XK nuclease family protein [Parerythrobacter jejuensis]|uniref:Double-strand break repair protein AddB n=1 Tax=Parerythrobacter jejuensis TaxID=795812 RepID=A0A845APE2_9SPHN|nr:PD-(D/E)XK nuclease family protein [Parerythrobacter jejuensis]MXP32160.1 double-strand break repair protein AddB [Parerythrobacter jejuensis]
MADRPGPNVYSIAAHRGFADALVAGLVPRYSDGQFGLARLTLLLPSTRTIRTVTEAFVRHFGEAGQQGLLMPRMVAVGDLDLDEALGSMLDPAVAGDIPPAVDGTYRWLRLAELLKEEMGGAAPKGPALLNLARDVGATMDRLLVEDIGPEELIGDRVLDLVGDLSGHWQDALRRFARIQAKWLAELEQMGRIDTAARRNRLFDQAARRWKGAPPDTPVVAAGVTSAAPALARMLRTIAELENGAVILPDLDLTLDDAVWDELGLAGIAAEADGPAFSAQDAVTHPQYHLKLLLNRMGIARGEVRAWHRRGLGASPPERSHAISALFLPPKASKAWVDLPAEKRRLSGVRLLETNNPEAEAQSVALAVRQALEQPSKRVAVVTPDRNLAGRVIQHLRRWNIEADDSAGRPLGQTPAGRVILLLAELIAERAAPVPLIALLAHPLVKRSEDRALWLSSVRALELELRGPRPAPGLAPLAAIAEEAQVSEWWAGVVETLQPLFTDANDAKLADLLDLLSAVGQALCGDGLWAQEDGRALSQAIEDLRINARDVGTRIDPRDLHGILSDVMDAIAVRPPYGGHPRVTVYGLLEARMSRADLIICAGLNEGSWPARATVDPLLAPPVLRALGVPGTDFRIGLAAHDLAGALGAPEVLLSRSERDAEGPAIASRFLLRVKALLGELTDRHSERDLPTWAAALDDGLTAQGYDRPQPVPTPEQRKVRISVTALDRLRSDPYQFYAGSILRLKELDTLDAEPTPAWQGQVAHAILENWHANGGDLFAAADIELEQMNAHPLTRALWEPRLRKALEWVKNTIEADDQRKPVLWEQWGAFEQRGVEIFGRIDRLDEMPDGSYAVIDYKTGSPPSGAQVEAGYALQLGTLGLIVGAGGFAKHGINGAATAFEYWSLGKSKLSDTGFGYVETPLMTGRKRSGLPPEDFLPQAQEFLDDALDRWILGEEPFTARLNPDAKSYGTYDQLMRLEEWLGREQ